MQVLKIKNIIFSKDSGKLVTIQKEKKNYFLDNKHLDFCKHDILNLGFIFFKFLP